MGNRCGTCRWYLTCLGDSTPAWSWCTWADHHAIPYCMEDHDFMVLESDGGLCQFWQEKESKDAA